MLNRREITCHRVTLVVDEPGTSDTAPREAVGNVLDVMNDVLSTKGIKARLYVGPDCADEDFTEELK